MAKQIFASLPVKDLQRSVAFLLRLGFSFASRAQVDTLVAQAVAAGGTAPRTPQDHVFMDEHGFEDLDGHIWELMYMAPASGTTS